MFYHTYNHDLSRDMRFPTMWYMCDQQRLRPAAQSDQSLCLSLEYSMSVKLLTEHHLEFLSLKGGCIGSSESTLVKMPHTGPRSAVGNVSGYRYVSDCRSRGREFDPGPVPYFR